MLPIEKQPEEAIEEDSTEDLNKEETIQIDEWENCKPLMEYVCKITSKENITDVTYSDIHKIENITMIDANLTELLKIFEKFTGLKRVLITGCDFKTIPEEIFKLENCTGLNLFDCNLKEIPDRVSAMKKLEILNVVNNDIVNISSDINKMRTLRHLFLDGNKNITDEALEVVYEMENGLSEL